MSIKKTLENTEQRKEGKSSPSWCLLSLFISLNSPFILTYISTSLLPFFTLFFSLNFVLLKKLSHLSYGVLTLDFAGCILCISCKLVERTIFKYSLIIVECFCQHHMVAILWLPFYVAWVLLNCYLLFHSFTCLFVYF